MYKYPFFLPDQNTVSRTHLPLGAILEFQISQNTKGEVLTFLGRRLLKEVSLCPYCLNLLILAQFEPLFGSRVSP